MYCWLNVGLVAVCPNISFLNLFDSSIPHVCWIVQLDSDFGWRWSCNLSTTWFNTYLLLIKPQVFNVWFNPDWWNPHLCCLPIFPTLDGSILRFFPVKFSWNQRLPWLPLHIPCLSWVFSWPQHFHASTSRGRGQTSTAAPHGTFFSTIPGRDLLSRLPSSY